MTPDQLRHAVPKMPITVAHAAAIAINAACARFDIDTSLRQAHFAAQALHESLGFTRMVENLDYSAEALLLIWPKRFTRETAQLYGRTTAHPANQQMIANVAYASRMGNGSIESGDGWRYRGRGPGQLTGKENYQKCGRTLGMNLAQFPEQVAQIQVGTQAFGWFWSTHGLNEIAVAPDLACTTRVRSIVNGGDLGLEACQSLLYSLLEVL
jgi:putative chitinase